MSLWTSVWVGTVRSVPGQPFQMTWSKQTFGPDGPWQAVTVNVGTPGVPIALYPGGHFWSHLFSPNICTNVSLGLTCYAELAGVYNPSSSSTSGLGVLSNGASSEGVDYSGGALQLAGSTPNSTMDQFDVGGGRVIPNVSIALHQTIYGTLPDGSAYPLEVGILSLGGPGVINQSFPGEAGTPLINTSMVAGWLYEEINPDLRTASNSWGLHIGSVTPKMSPSLIFGGFDQNRVLGTISSQHGNPVDGSIQNPTTGTIDLVDISINVIQGASPWKFSNMDGLLTSGNSSIGTALTIGISAMTPYLYLPKSTCDAIAAQLPVTYEPKYGLYFWNTQDPLYTKIITSASALSFTFRRDEANANNFTVNVPFMLLNLTLEAPLTTTPTPYFPCQALITPYQLGRAFLQAAFFGANWNANDDETVWWLAQAPGPNIPVSPNVVAIGAQDTAIAASSNDWATSWDGVWTPLPQTSDTVNATTPVPSNSKSSTGTSGLSTGAIAGIAVGIVIVIGAALAGAFILWRRKRTREKELPAVVSEGPRKSNLSGQPAVIPAEPQEMHSEGRFTANGRMYNGYNPVEQSHFNGSQFPGLPQEMASDGRGKSGYGPAELL